MICIFNGVPSHLRIKEPGEGIRLGVDPMPGETIDSDGLWQFQADWKDVNGNLVPKEPITHPVQYKSVNVNVRNRTNDVSVLKISDLLGDGGWGEGLMKGGLVATQLMQFPYQQDFQYDSLAQDVRTDPTTDTERRTRVNSSSIVIDESFVEDVGNEVERKNSQGGQ